MKIKRIGQAIAGLSLVLFLAGCATGSGEKVSNFVEDSVLTAKVKSALLKDPAVSGTAVHVETFRGLVQLSGFVKSAAERSRAEKLAQDIDGVTTVINSIVIR